MRFIKYFFVGGLAALVDIGFFYLGAVLLHRNYLIVGALSFILATLVNYLVSIRVVFQSGIRFSKKYELIAIFIISGFGLLLNQLILYICTSQHIFGLLFSKLTATGGVFLWNYILRSRFVFASAKKPISVAHYDREVPF